MHSPKKLASNMSSTQTPDLTPQVSLNPPQAVIWIVNPFDELPNATDVPLRYWALCRTLAEQGHEVIWWSSNFSHRTKTHRAPCPPTDGFTLRLIKTAPYAKNISLARLKNHKQFAQGFYRDAMAALQSGELDAPDRIVVSLPPLGVAEQAFKIRDFVNRRATTAHSHAHSAAQPLPLPCEVVVDIMDAWPETFYQVLPKPLRRLLGPILLAPMHRSSKRAYQGADKISAVGQSYLNLAENYLATKSHKKAQKKTPHINAESLPPGQSSVTESWAANSEARITHPHSKTSKPLFLCYHGTDLERVEQKTEGRGQKTGDREQGAEDSSLRIPPPSLCGKVAATPHSPLPTLYSAAQPLQLVYIGALETSYDLRTIIQATQSLNQNGIHTEFHIAGAGSQQAALKEIINQTNQALDAPIVFFHGHCQKAELDALLKEAHFGMIPMKDDSFVGLPYKIADYTRMGLPILSSLAGECYDLIKHKKAGAFYRSGSSASLVDAIQSIIQQPAHYTSMSIHSRQIAEQLFDRSSTYPALAAFILNPAGKNE